MSEKMHPKKPIGKRNMFRNTVVPGGGLFLVTFFEEGNFGVNLRMVP